MSKVNRKALTKTATSRKVTAHDDLSVNFTDKLFYELAKDQYTTTSYDTYLALSLAIRDKLVEQWIQSQQEFHRNNSKRVYYLSLEFLIGRLLGNNLLNLGMDEKAHETMHELGFDLDEVRNEEVDAGLGNGGLGRLAACFLDSMATLGIPAHGYGIRYDYGIFNQKIQNGHQVEYPDEWLKLGNPWEFARPEYAVKVRFYGHTFMYRDKFGKLKVLWRDTEDVIAMPYDIPVPGYKNGIVNSLRLWSAKASEDFDLEYFNHGDYEKAVYKKMFSENISKVLYPNDANAVGKELRLKQEYFFTAASIADIIRRFKSENSSMRALPDKASIQLNDTHPALAVVEFMRVLIDDEDVEWDAAWDITQKTFAYTNHTILPEALETWSVPLFSALLPRHMQIIYEINARFLREVANQYPGDTRRLERMSLIQEGSTQVVRMAFLAIVGSHSVNGVSALHTELLKKELFRDFHQFYPHKFNNKTNGITPRRWVKKANPRLSDCLTNRIGDGWIMRLEELKHLSAYEKDKIFHEELREIKQDNKRQLSAYIKEHCGIKVNPESLFDVQVKRIHEYKRQTLFALYIISQYLQIKEHPRKYKTPRTFIFSGKAAPGYTMAKLIIKFINNIADVINHDRAIKDKLKVVFLENYRVSLAERIFPASDLSEQISTAGKEASGTGCMKFMMNGALTVGTYDGANIEMAEEVGEENMFMFGLRVEEVQALWQKGYSPQPYIEKSPILGEVINMIRSNFFSQTEQGLFEPLVQSIIGPDSYMVCADFDHYCETQKQISENFLDEHDWWTKVVRNIAASGKFSSDRTISQYAEDIWNVPVQSKKPS